MHMRMMSVWILALFFSEQIVCLTQSPVQNIDNMLAEQEKQLHAAVQKKKKLHQLLYSCSGVQSYTHLITWFEWQELALSEYVRIFDRTVTSSGTWGLEQLTKPIIHDAVIVKRQKGIEQIVGDSKKLGTFDTLFAELKAYEDDLLPYFDEHDELHGNAEQLYYSYFKTILNGSKVALDYAYVFDSCHAVTNIASLLCITGLMNEFLATQISNEPMNIMQGIKNGLGGLARAHSFDNTLYNRYKAQGAFAVSQISSPEPSSWARVLKTLSQPAVAHTFLRGSFGDKWTYLSEQTSMGTVASFLWILSQVVYQDHRLWLSIQQSYARLIFLYTTHVALQHRLYGVARWCTMAHELCLRAHEIDGLNEHPIIKQACAVYVDDVHPKMKKLFALLRADTFADKGPVFYSRGHVLITHALMKEMKEMLLPLMQAVGIIDGYISICRVYKSFKNDLEHPFCLVDFIKRADPEIEIMGGWLPLITKNQVQSSIELGGMHAAPNMILTGPNGGGKSSILKLMGGIAVLAHAWGIVPARTCTMNVLGGLRTSFNPPEDISQNLSTFMAQKKRLDYVLAYVKTTASEDKTLILIDEPYRGTIEVEAEKRAHRLGYELAQFPNCMTVMASHLQKPIMLAESSNYINRHLEVIMEGDAFMRTFKLCDGVAWWWFNDIERRMKFIDQLHAKP